MSHLVGSVTSKSTDMSDMFFQFRYNNSLRQAIYSHPLIPLVKLLFTRCYRTTDIDYNPELSVDNEIREFIQKKMCSNNLNYRQDSLVDSLIINVIDVLREHLFELHEIRRTMNVFLNESLSRVKHIYTDNTKPSGKHLHLSKIPENLVFKPRQIDQSEIVDDQSAVSNPENQDEISSKKRRKMFSKEVVQLLRRWLTENIEHPYPSDDIKKDLCSKTNLSSLQINNWFINARRRMIPRIVKPTEQNFPPAHVPETFISNNSFDLGFTPLPTAFPSGPYSYPGGPFNSYYPH